MKIVQTALIVLRTIAAFQSVDSLRILGVFPYGSRLHYNSGRAIFMALAEKGHQVVFISPTRTEYPPENFDQVVLREPEKFLTPRKFWLLTTLTTLMHSIVRFSCSQFRANFTFRATIFCSYSENLNAFNVFLCFLIFIPILSKNNTQIPFNKLKIVPNCR